jgi:phosphosulfolactate synthase (CoM biosynthesis protein A)
VGRWRAEAITSIVSALGLKDVMFEAADPEVFAWYIRVDGPEVNLFVVNRQIVQFQALRSGL